MKSLNYKNDLLREILFKNYQNLIFIIFLMVVTGVIQATSSLDSHSELLIKESIENLTGETTIICIAHRLSTIQSADRIYYLEAGKIIEEGTFKELIDRKESSFRKTAKLQGIV